MSNNITNEEWRPVVGYEGVYEVSNYGRVARIQFYRGRGGLLTPIVSNGYLRVGLYSNNVKTLTLVHRIVARAFIGEPTAPQINHIDGNKQNNRVDNLEYCTGRENSQHAIRIGLRDSGIGEMNPSVKLTQQEVDEIRVLYIKGDITQRELARIYKVHFSTIWLIVHNKKWVK